MGHIDPKNSSREEKSPSVNSSVERNIDFENKPSWFGVTFAGLSLKSCVKRNKSQIVLNSLGGKDAEGK